MVVEFAVRTGHIYLPNHHHLYSTCTFVTTPCGCMHARIQQQWVGRLTALCIAAVHMRNSRPQHREPAYLQMMMTSNDNCDSCCDTCASLVLAMLPQGVPVCMCGCWYLCCCCCCCSGLFRLATSL